MPDPYSAEAVDLGFNLVPRDSGSTTLYVDASMARRKLLDALPDLEPEFSGHRSSMGSHVVRWAGIGGSLHLIGIGERGRALVRGRSMEILQVLQTHARKPIAISLATPILRMDAARRGQSGLGRYRTSKLVVSTHTESTAKFRKATLEDQKEIVRSMVHADLCAYAQAAGITLPRFAVIDVCWRNDVVIPEVAGGTLWALAVRDVQLTLSATLSGPWFVGRLTNKGFGALRPDRRGVSAPADPEKDHAQS